MKINHIILHNFRGIIHEEFSLSDYTLLVGSNNAGKSTIIALFMKKININIKMVQTFLKKARLTRTAGLKLPLICLKANMKV